MPRTVLCLAHRLSRALKEGTLSAVDSATSANVLTYLFVELEPQLIIRCVNELRSGLILANWLYKETVMSNAPPSPAWEKAVQHLL
jgi:hypothetical protein